jgi:hypothetical protein
MNRKPHNRAFLPGPRDGVNEQLICKLKTAGAKAGGSVLIFVLV